MIVVMSNEDVCILIRVEIVGLMKIIHFGKSHLT